MQVKPGMIRNPVRVVYIMGCGRSGSTALDIVLGNHSQVESVGELKHLFKRGWLKGEYCACGERGDSCPYWSAVRREWVARTGDDNLEGFVELQNMFERTRRIPRLLKEARLGSPKFQKYAKRAHAIYKAIQTVSGKPIIVDSSKNPARALALSLVPGIELSLIHMVRDGRGVIWSRMKSFRKNEQAGIERYLRSWPTWRSSFDWALGNCLSEWVARRVGSSLRLRYEDVVEKPDDALTTIGEYLGISLDSIAKKLAAGTKLFVGHNIAGSRIRMSKAITLYPDYEWKERLPRRSRFLFWILVGVVAKRYGYGKP